MIKSPIFLDVILPACVSAGFLGFLALLVLSRLLYDYVQKHYSDMLAPTHSQSFWVDQDMAMAFIGDVWTLTRQRSFRRIASPFWRGLFWVNAVVGALTTVALAVLCLSFVL